VVRDGHVFTGGGVTAGIDFVFTLMNEIAGPQFAQTHPPFDAGSPARAPKAIKSSGDKRYAHRIAAFEEVLGRVAPSL
jgi:cyclohexyl-isocyanide hydratase